MNTRRGMWVGKTRFADLSGNITNYIEGVY